METKNVFFIPKTLTFLIALAAALATTYLFITSKRAAQEAPLLSPDTLIVGMMSGWAPYMSLNSSGKFEGFDVDVARELAKRMNKKLVINDMGSLEPLFIALNQRKIDMIFSGLDIIKKRLQMLEMVPYTGEGITCFKLLFWNKIPEGITGVNDLINRSDITLCVEPGSGTENFLNQEQFKNILKKPIGRVSDMILELRFGKSQAAILEPIAIVDLLKKNPELKAIDIPLPEDFQIFGVGIAIKKGNITLKEETTKIINSMKADGSLAALEKKWQVGGVQS